MNSSIAMTLPCETNSTNSVIRRPKAGQRDRADDDAGRRRRDADADHVAGAVDRSHAPRRRSRARSAPGVRVPRKKSISGRCVTISAISTTIAQNADSDGDSSSTIRHQISMPIGMQEMQARPSPRARCRARADARCRCPSAGRDSSPPCTLRRHRARPTTHVVAYGAAAPSIAVDAAQQVVDQAARRGSCREMPSAVRRRCTRHGLRLARRIGCMPSFSASRCTM